MEYIVALVIALVTAAIGVWAYSFLNVRFKAEQDEVNMTEEDISDVKNKKRICSAAVYFQTVKGLLPRQWVLIACCLLLNALVAVKTFTVPIDYFFYARTLIVAVLLAVVLIIDWNSRTIPNCIILTILVIGVLIYLLQLIVAIEAFKLAIIGAAVGLLGNFILFYVMSRITKEGIGMGDVKLLAALGWMTGVQTTLASVLFSLLLCSALALVLIFTKKKQASDSVPFGPFIYFGYMIALLICNF